MNNPTVDYKSVLDKLLDLTAKNQDEQSGINKAIKVLTSEPFVEDNHTEEPITDVFSLSYRYKNGFK